MTPPPLIIIDEGLPGLMTYSLLLPTQLSAGGGSSGSGLRPCVARHSFSRVSLQFISHVGTHQVSVTLSVPEKQRKLPVRNSQLSGGDAHL